MTDRLSPATILHVDLDAFYASVEQLLDPRLRGKPIAVGGGVVLAASYDAGLSAYEAACLTARAATLSGPRFCRRTFRRIPTARRRRHRSPERFHAFHRAHLHRRGLRRRGRVHASLRFARGDRQDRSGACARRAWV